MGINNDTKNWFLTVPIAHRGLYNNEMGIPENSLLAFKEAATLGYGIELDVHLSKDGVVMVYHDESLERLTGQKGNLCEKTLPELKSLRLLGTDQSLPTLQEVLDLVAGRVPLLIEIKNERNVLSQLEPAVFAILKKYTGPYAVISFAAASIAFFRHQSPNILRGQNIYPPMGTISGAPEKSFWQQFIPFIKDIMGSRPKFIVYDHEIIHPRVIQFLKAFFPLISYKVYDEQSYHQARLDAINVIFENIHPILEQNSKVLLDKNAKR